MQIERPETSTLLIKLDNKDIPESTYRFMECIEIGENVGWDINNKISLNSRNPRNTAQFENDVTVHLDGDGDVYLTLWDTPKLQSAESPIELKVGEDPRILADPYDKLAYVGIKSVLISLPDKEGL